MKILIFLTLLITTQFVFSQETESTNTTHFKYTQPQIPNQFNSQIEEYIFFDNNFNVVQRLRSEEKSKANLMSEDAKLPVDVSIFEVELSKLGNDVFVSQFVESSDLAKTVVDGKIIIPCLNSDVISYNTLKIKFGAPKYKTLGRKVLSRATYFIEPVGQVGGFFAKFVPHIPGLNQKIEREVLVNDYVKSQLSELPPEMRNLTMDSYMAVNLNVLGIPIAVAYRSANRILRDKEVNIKTYPGHGLLGCDSCIRDFAIKLTGLSDADKAVDRWKSRELLPKLAKYMAYANHALGVSFESHTQNMIFDIDTVTGQIKNIYFRDFADVLLNPIPLLAEGRLPIEIEWSRVKLLSVHGNYFSDQGVQAAKDIWYHASIYSGQGITSHITGFQKQQRHLRVFLESYIAETEKILGHSIDLSEDAKKVMSQLEQKISKDEFYSGELKERSPLRNAMASILKSVFEQVYAYKIDKIQNELATAVVVKDYKKISRNFYNLMLAQRVVFMSDEAKVSLTGKDTKHTWLKNTLNAYLKLGLSTKKFDEASITFKIHDNRLWAVDRISNKVLAATIEAYESKKSTFEKISDLFLLKKANSVIKSCESLFSH